MKPAGPQTLAVAYPSSSWPTYHRTANRNGYYPALPAPHGLHYLCSRRLDGQVYAQPLIVGSLLIIATEHNSVYAFSLVTHVLIWHSGLGTPEPRTSLPCGKIAPSVGITGTPVYDPATGSIFAVGWTTGGSYTLFSIAISTGRIRWHRPLDIAGRDRRAEQQRGALAVANGRIYVPFGGLFGDCGNYVDYLAAWATSGVGTMTKYVVPTKREGGICAAPGPARTRGILTWVHRGRSYCPPAGR